MSVHPLRPDTHRCLGGPLPHQLANGTRAHPKAELQLPFLTYLYVNEHIRYYLIFLLAIPIFRAGHPRVTHQSATLGEKLSSPLTVRLACLRRAASVRSEPGSNSPLFYFKHPEGRLISIILKASPVSFILGTLTFKRKKK